MQVVGELLICPRSKEQHVTRLYRVEWPGHLYAADAVSISKLSSNHTSVMNSLAR
jgi:hypothetical protein